jgi:hypothetical protein
MKARKMLKSQSLRQDVILQRFPPKIPDIEKVIPVHPVGHNQLTFYADHTIDWLLDNGCIECVDRKRDGYIRLCCINISYAHL